MLIEIIQADLENRKNASDLLYLLEQYAFDVTGGGQPLSKHVKENLIQEL